jgi:hypothetical protein
MNGQPVADVVLRTVACSPFAADSGGDTATNPWLATPWLNGSALVELDHLVGYRQAASIDRARCRQDSSRREIAYGCADYVRAQLLSAALENWTVSAVAEMTMRELVTPKPVSDPGSHQKS